MRVARSSTALSKVSASTGWHAMQVVTDNTDVGAEYGSVPQSSRSSRCGMPHKHWQGVLLPSASTCRGRTSS